MFLFDALHHGANRTDLIISAGDSRIDELISKSFSVFANIQIPFQITPGWKTNYLAGWVILQIPEVNLKPVGIKTEREFAAVLFLNVVTLVLDLLRRLWMSFHFHNG